MQTNPLTQGRTSATALNAEILIDAPPAEVWEVVGENFAEINRYSPEVASSHYLRKVDGMVGSQRRSEMHDGRTLDVEITGWEAANHVEWEIVKPHIAILKSGVSRYILVAQGSQTRLVLDGYFETIISLLNPIAKRRFKSVVADDLAGIKRLVEDGETASVEDAGGVLDRYKGQIVFGG